MSVITWDHVDNQQTILTEKQLESVFLLNSLNSVHEETTISNSDSPNITTTTITDQFDKCEDHITQNNDVSIHTASHFYSWLWSVEQNLSAEIPKVPSEFLTFISRRKCECSKVLNIVEEILSKLSTLENNYLSISQSTNELHELCEHLLKQQNEMIEYANSIEDSLVNFVQVDMIQAELKVSNFVVSHEKLLPMLNKLDSSLIYFRDHPDFKESPNYLIKVKSSLKIALDHIKAHVTNIIGRTINELLELHDVISPENSFILLYGRFRSQGPKIRSLMTLLEDRVHVTDEYAHVIQECHKFYLHHREELLTPIAQNGVSDLVQKYRGDHCALLRTAGAFMVHMCEDEMRLFNQFFSPQFSQSINQMLQKLCRCLYDAVRPLIIHINHVEILSELCDILKYELLQYDDPQKTITNSPDMMAFTDLCSMLLADIQERLVFRAHIYIKSQIFGFVPSPGDLSYPEKLEMMNDIAESISVPTNSNNSSDQKNESAESEAVTSGTDSSESNQQKASTTSDLVIQPGPNMSLAPADLHGMWYPTVRRTLVCLSKLSRCLDANSFRGLAQECVSMCVLSLVKASESISLRRTTIDGQLFLIKHLLILREQMVPFGIEFLVKETSLDFSPYKNVARSIWEHKGSGLFSLTKENALLRFLLETPNAIDIELDSRRQLDSQLKYTCELLIEQQIMLLTGEIPNFLKRAHSILAAPGARLADQPFASVSYIKEIVSNAHRLLCSALGRSSNRPDTTIKHNSVPNLRKCLHIYLANPDTENILLRRIQSGVISQWRSMFQLLTDHYNDEDRMIIGCPTESQIRLLFQDICNRPVLVSS